MLGCAFELRLRRTDGTDVLVIALMGITVPITDRTTMSRCSNIGVVQEYLR